METLVSPHAEEGATHGCSNATETYEDPWLEVYSTMGYAVTQSDVSADSTKQGSRLASLL